MPALLGREGSRRRSQSSCDLCPAQPWFAIAIERQRSANRTYIDDGVLLLGLARSAGKLFRAQSAKEKRRMLDLVLSNCSWKDGTLTAQFRQPFDLLAVAISGASGGEGAESAETARTEKWLPEQDSNLRQTG